MHIFSVSKYITHHTQWIFLKGLLLAAQNK
jgi:hypothetical protein